MNQAGERVGRMHLRHVWPLPKGLDAIFSNYKAVLVPEMNLGQMARILRSEFPQHNFLSFTKVQGQPFRAKEIADRITNILEN
jgi:2-oxoglutarate/2-oxoacid ferredoxin oxidoreductase subunit alpha